MTTVRIPLSFDNGDIGSARFVELPVTGRDNANLLVMIDGLALPPFDSIPGDAPVDDADLHIGTNYKVKDQDTLIDSSAYACFGGVQADDDASTGSKFDLTLGSTSVVVATSGVVQLNLRIQLAGDLSVTQIGYQVNLVLRRPT
jgi:hypothetical protein